MLRYRNLVACCIPPTPMQHLTMRCADYLCTGEHASLNAINDAVPSLCPRSYAHGAMTETNNSYFLVTDFLDLSPRSSSSTSKGSGLSLAQKLVKLHTTPAPIPEGHDQPGKFLTQLNCTKTTSFTMDNKNDEYLSIRLPCPKLLRQHNPNQHIHHLLGFLLW